MITMDGSPLERNDIVSMRHFASAKSRSPFPMHALAVDELERFPSAVALAMLAQEEYAKAFMLVLVRDGCLPWTRELRRAARNRECKHLVGVIIERLGA